MWKRYIAVLLCLCCLLAFGSLSASAKEIAVNYTWYDFAGYTSTGEQVSLTYGQYTSAPNFMRFQNTDYFTDTGKYLDIYLEMESDIPEKAYLDFTVTLFLRTSQYTSWQPYVTASCYGGSATGLLQEGTIVSGSYTGLTYKISLFAENGMYAGNATNTMTIRFGYTKTNGQGNFDIGYKIDSFVVNTEDTVQDTVKDQTNAIGGWFADLGDKIGGWFTDLTDSIGGWFNNILSEIKSFFTSIGSWFASVGTVIKDFIGDIVDFYYMLYSIEMFLFTLIGEFPPVILTIVLTVIVVTILYLILGRQTG